MSVVKSRRVLNHDIRIFYYEVKFCSIFKSRHQFFDTVNVGKSCRVFNSRQQNLYPCSESLSCLKITTSFFLFFESKCGEIRIFRHWVKLGRISASRHQFFDSMSVVFLNNWNHYNFFMPLNCAMYHFFRSATISSILMHNHS